ncbi:ethanolamine kinase 1-like [Protopterus annectens]|uniref:ethanolamine kinase 1-like n=1 Tax=Protopterus annectens TaxID=7888 RepID=UPI001CFC0339|nr:ethanolamine kinase 1-like [Protopterus annectens]
MQVSMASYYHMLCNAEDVRKLNITVEEHNIQNGALELMKALRPEWDCSEIRIELFTDGITNKLLACYVEDMSKDVVLVRIYGNKTELFVDRDTEIKSFLILYAQGCAPQLYCTFNNGLCYAYMPGTALDPDHVRNPQIFRY